jgi:hypothetical protein
LNHIEISTVVGFHQPDNLDIEIALRSLQRQRKKELSKCCDRNAGLSTADQPQTLAIDDRGWSTRRSGHRAERRAR